MLKKSRPLRASCVDRNWPHPPPSVGNFFANLSAVFIFFAVLIFVNELFPMLPTFMIATIGLIVGGGILGIYEWFHLKVYTRASTELRPLPRPVDRARVTIKLIGLFGTILFILLCYHLNPLYRNSTNAVLFYGPFFSFLQFIMPAIVIGTILYFPAIDRRQDNPYDGYWHSGCLLTGRFKSIDWVALQEHGRVWMIKGFFLPIMFALLVSYLDSLIAINIRVSNFMVFYIQMLNIWYAIDVFYGVLGYILTVRATDTHIRSTEPTLLGWIVCLMCYHPFSQFGTNFFYVDDGMNWNHWLEGLPIIFYLWGTAIILLSAVNALATVALGLRMSNLTFRGLITNGPYRFTKHPAYLCKIASWWLISLPFLTTGPLSFALKQTAGLTIVSIIYYFRARTEENHLSNYPEYVAYAEWINDHGLFRVISKRFPALRYSKEKSATWKSIVWFKKPRASGNTIHRNE